MANNRFAQYCRSVSVSSRWRPTKASVPGPMDDICFWSTVTDAVLTRWMTSLMADADGML